MTHTHNPQFRVTQVILFEVTYLDEIRTPDRKRLEKLSIIKRNKLVNSIEEYKRLQELKYSRDLAKEIEVNVVFTDKLEGDLKPTKR